MTRRKALIPESQQALNDLKAEIAAQLGVDYNAADKGLISSKDNGSVGGEMVRRMIAFAEQSIK